MFSAKRFFAKRWVRAYSQAFAALLSCSASAQTPTACARSWIDQVAEIGGMNKEKKKLGQSMTMDYVTQVLRMHGMNRPTRTKHQRTGCGIYDWAAFGRSGERAWVVLEASAKVEWMSS